MVDSYPTDVSKGTGKESEVRIRIPEIFGGNLAAPGEWRPRVFLLVFGYIMNEELAYVNGIPSCSCRMSKLILLNHVPWATL